MTRGEGFAFNAMLTYYLMESRAYYRRKGAPVPPNSCGWGCTHCRARWRAIQRGEDELLL